MSAGTPVLLAVVGLLPAASFAAGLSARPESAPALDSLRSLTAIQALQGAPAVSGGAVAAPSMEDPAGKVCASPLPVLVLDNFSRKGEALRPYMDVDGDGKPDVGHGEVVSAIYKASGKKTIPLNMEGDGSIANLVELLGPVASKLEKGQLRLSAINVSQCVDVPLTDVQTDLKLPYTSEQFLARRSEINAAIIKLMDAHGSYDYGELTRIAERIAKKGVPILLAAGNQGPGKMNLLGFLPGTVSVGSLDRKGAKVASSADNGLVSLWRRGEHAFRRTADGSIDVNGDGTGDFDATHMSRGTSIAAAYAGKPVAEFLRETPKDPELDVILRDTEGGIAYLMERLPEGVYRVEDMVSFFRIPPSLAGAMRARGRYVDKSRRFSFDEDGAGRLVFDPAGDGSPDQVFLMSGTSFAAPAVCLK